MNLLLIENLDWQKGEGLIPAIIQDANTLSVLMLGYMNQQALQATLEMRLVTFYSRSKDRLWIKGETSGNFLKLIKIMPDCDNDTLLVLAEPCGNICHLGHQTCFGEGTPGGPSFLVALEKIITERFKDRQPNSYTAQLFEQGTQRIAQKVGEEGVEVALSAMGQSAQSIINESADLIYHLLVLLKNANITFHEVCQELEKRHGSKHA